jgi:hypothetical protein
LRRRSSTAVGFTDAVDFASPSADVFFVITFASPSADAFLAFDIFVVADADAVPEADTFIAII